VEAINIRQVIQQTDKEIDALVYQLYGLSEEEIRIVEVVKQKQKTANERF
jgi:hypothetical protein